MGLLIELLITAAIFWGLIQLFGGLGNERRGL